MGKAKRLREQRAREDRAAERGGEESPYPSTARSYELKVWRANVHLEQLKAQLDGWIDAALQTVEEAPDPDHPGYHASWVTPPKPDHASFSLLAGDCLQCLRSALDHLAFELATHSTTPVTDDIEQASEWPIVSDIDRRGQPGAGPRKWQDGARLKIRGVDPDAQAIIQGLQPYNRGDSYGEDPLWRLATLNNVDKHRSIHVVGMLMKGAGITMPGPGVSSPSWINVASLGFPDGRESVIEIGAEVVAESRTKVARWVMQPVDPAKEMKMNFIPQLDIAFDAETPLVGGEPVYQTLADIHNYILSDVIPPLLPFINQKPGFTAVI